MRKTAIFFLVLLLPFRIPLVNSATDEGYGEANENLGQFTDTFINETFITVLQNVIVNTTSECVELNYTVVYQDFDTFTETDPNNRITPDKYNVSWIGLKRSDSSRVVRDYGVGNIVNFNYSFEFSLTDLEAGGAASRGIAHNFVLTQVDDVGWGQHYTLAQTVQNGVDDSTYFWWMTSKDAPAGSVTQIGAVTMNVDQIYYIRYFQSGGNKTFIIYDDSAFTNVVEKLTHVVGNDAYRYLQVVKVIASGVDPNDFSTGYIFELSNGTGYAPEGYFITENYLNYTTGNSLTLLTNTSIPGGSTMTLQFSNDNSSWILNDWEPIFGGFEAIDLRVLNYSDLYLMYNFSGDSLVTPRLYQSRIVTTKGTTGGAPGVTVIESDAPWIALAIILSIIAFLLAMGIKR